MRLGKFLNNIKRDMLLFVFILAVVCIFREYFIGYMSGYMNSGTDVDSIAMASWTGLRLSLKTAGGITLFTFVFATLVNIINHRWNLDKLRLWIGSAAVFILSVLFQARFPYYREFNMTFNMQVIQGINDDRGALLSTVFEEYGLVWRFAVALALTAAGAYLWDRLLKWAAKSDYMAEWANKLSTAKKCLMSVGLVAVIGVFGLFVRFGGSFNYDNGVSFLSAAVTNDDFLNECVLDDVQAMYRVREFALGMKTGKIEGVEKEHIRDYLQMLAQYNLGAEINSNMVSTYLMHKSKGASLPKPKHIFIILGESWAQWPMMAKYDSLHVADGIKSLMADENAYSSCSFLPNGEHTASAIAGLITGLNDTGVSPEGQLRSFKEIYPTSFAKPFKRLGYKVDFWYGGPVAWDNLNRLAVDQGFDHYYGYSDFGAERQNAWGTKDINLFNAIENSLAEEAPTVHVIMTTTNHPPYNLDLAAEGFDVDAARAAVARMNNVDNPDELANELGHYWYMDKVVTAFVRETMEKYPDCLFIITGDHAVRSDPGTKPTMFEHQSVPFLLYGMGVNKNTLPDEAAGGHTSIMPTLIELIAPAGFEYCSIAEPMTDKGCIGFNPSVWSVPGIIGSNRDDKYEVIPGGLFASANGAAQANDGYVSPTNGTVNVESSAIAIASMEADVAVIRQKTMEWRNAMRTVSWWLLVNGDDINGNDIE